MSRLSLSLRCALLMLSTLAGCGPAAASDGEASLGGQSASIADDPDGAPADALTALRNEINELYARPEHDAASVEVQHLLVSFVGVRGMGGVTRSQGEAEQLAADLMVRIHGGEDFDALIKEYTNDSHPGIYPMTRASRSRMVPAFGDVAWRLEVDEFGVAPFHVRDSPYGWHIIQRRK